HPAAGNVNGVTWLSVFMVWNGGLAGILLTIRNRVVWGRHVRMKLGVSAWRLSGQPLGVTRYLEYLVRHWDGIVGTDDEITLYVARLPTEGQRRSLGRSRVVLVKPRLTNALWENLLLPLRARGLDV